MSANPIPAAELDVDEELVRALLADQAPDLAARPLTAVPTGWDTFLFRLGDDLVVRLPRRAVVAEMLALEHRWLPVVAPQLPVAAPVPLVVGRPAQGFPWPWSVCPWFPGTDAMRASGVDEPQFAREVAAVVAALHRPAPADAPRNPYRGGPLADRAPAVEERAARMSAQFDTGAVAAVWADALDAPPWEAQPVWIHGDLHIANLVVDDGRLVAVVDWIDLCAGDPATDLAAAWGLFGRAGREAFVAALAPVDAATWRRARGWALYFGLTYLAEAADRPAFQRLGGRVLDGVRGRGSSLSSGVPRRSGDPPRHRSTTMPPVLSEAARASHEPPESEL